jgi:soluble lytic murein transglycosylase-like protein
MEHGIQVSLLTGLIEKESVFNASAATEIPGKSGDFARGLMQIYQGESVQIDKDRAYDLGYNLDTGCTILNKKLQLANGDLEKALSNYSGRAQGYSDDVLKGVGRYTLYKWQQNSPVQEALAVQ